MLDWYMFVYPFIESEVWYAPPRPTVLCTYRALGMGWLLCAEYCEFLTSSPVGYG